MNEAHTPGRWRHRLGCVLAVVALALSNGEAQAQAQADDQRVIDAREALGKKDVVKLAASRDATSRHALAQWVDYWELSSRLDGASVEEVEAFYARWPGTYVEDRLRNDWLLELGKRRDWANFARDYPRFRMNDDREVSCYALLTQHLDGKDVRDAARTAWFEQRDADAGCNLLASTLFAVGQLGEADAWQEARLSVQANRLGAARAAAALIGPDIAAAVSDLMKNPQQALKRGITAREGVSVELATLALLRLARNEPEAAAEQLDSRWQRVLPKHLASLAWAGVGQSAALALSNDAPAYYQRAAALWRESTPAKRAQAPWTDDMLLWQARSALRLDGPAPERWARVALAVQALGPADRQDAAWVYWRARSQLALASPGSDGDADRLAARSALETIGAQLSFYGKLAREDLGGALVLPAAPAPLTPGERDAAARNPGLARALVSFRLGLRSEAVREWNFSIRGMNDRELLAAAQLACDNAVWDRCINTSERTRQEVDMAQRFPMPYRTEVLAKAREAGLEPAFVYGLIRQESRFMLDIRSSAGASGLMQLMPATARWTAKKIGVPYQSQQITDRDMNLLLGSSYLKLLMDDFGGSMAMATAAYNAGPGRPRRWREGPLLEPAAWAENIPFNETRDYVKKVLSNSVYYSAVMGGKPATLKARLGPNIGPRDSAEPVPNGALP
jgi:soluble lytic murein transglycosylase